MQVVDRQLAHQRRQLLDQLHLDAGLPGDPRATSRSLCGQRSRCLPHSRSGRLSPEPSSIAARSFFDVDAERAGEPQRLDVGADVRPEEDVVRGLRDLARADVADVDDGARARLARSADAVDDGLVAAAEEDELTLLGAALAADERAVDHVDAALGAAAASS